jgi:3-methyladenine DNA glycosylase Tag
MDHKNLNIYMSRKDVKNMRARENHKTLVTLNNIAKISKYKINETREMMEYYRNITLDNMTNSEIYAEICWIVYSSGFRYDIIKKYWNLIEKEFYYFDINKVASFIDDVVEYSHRICKNSGFNNVRKAQWCIKNAVRFIELDHEKINYGGLKGYLLELSKKEPYELIEMAPLLIEELKLNGIGKITIFHLMKNIGINIFKPDIHVRRILLNLGLISKENLSIKEIYYIMKDVSEKMQIDLVELDTLLFSYGRIFGDEILS